MQIERRQRLTSAEVESVLDVIDQAEAADDVSPFSEHVLLHLRYGGESPAINLLAWSGDQLVGYAHLDPTDPVEGASAELTVLPSFRRQGIGRALLADVIAAAGDGPIRLWAHGDHPAAAALAAALNLHRSRTLWLMQRTLGDDLPEPVWPPGIEVRTFEVGRDEDAWLKVNSRAFAALPDQGSWDIGELQMREQEAWFDPAGFFLAFAGDKLVGFHWTKVHGGDRDHGHDHDPIGEVYVVGVDPDAAGMHLGKALTLAGLQHLTSLGLSRVMLYVDETNSGAIALYSKLGFEKLAIDVSFSRSGSAVYS